MLHKTLAKIFILTKNLYEHFPCKSPGSHCYNYSKIQHHDNSVAASVVCILAAEDHQTVVEHDNDLHDELFVLVEVAAVAELLRIYQLEEVFDAPEAGD